MAQINFKGKSIIWNHHLGVKYHQLVPQKDKSVSKKLSLHDNLIIHGDNLKALKALLPTYSGKIKCIYIDPPYNTGNENWVYNDNVSHPMFKDWLKKTVDKDDLTKHDKWLCMMTPRLKLLRELLSEDGVIFISIDDNEQHRLRMLMDEIFGEDNFIANIVWHRKRGKDNSAKYLSKVHEYVLIYAKKIEYLEFNKLELDRSTLKAYTNPDSDKRGRYRKLGLWRRGGQGGSKEYGFTTKEGVKIPPRQWLVNEETMKRLDFDNKLVVVGKNLYRKLFLSEHQGSIPETIWTDTSNVANASDLIKSIFGSQIFDTPKPVPLIKKILKISTNKNDFILDSFAGSGTTAQAVLELNKEDCGNRKFILVEMEDYADSITAERVRRVIKKGLPGTFSYFDLGNAIEMEEILSGKNLPSYKELARYVFYTATGEEFDESKINEPKNLIGESRDYQVYLFYKPDLKYLKSTALTLDLAKSIGVPNGKQRLIFAPTKFVDQDTLDHLHISFAQLPFEIYKLAK